MNEAKSCVCGTLLLLLLSLGMSSPAAGQYRDNLGGNWSNPASATITNIIMDRYARRRLEQRLAERRGPSSAPARRPSEATETAPKINDASVRFRSTGTQLKTREIANLIAAGNQQIFTLLTTFLREYDKEALKIGKPNDLALALSFFFATNASVYHDRGIPPDAQVLELRNTIAAALVEDNGLNGVTDRQKQEMFEALVLYTGLALSGYQEGKQGGNAETVSAYRQIAGLNLQAVTGISPDKINFTDQGLSIDREGDAAGNSAAKGSATANAPAENRSAASIQWVELIRQYDTNEIAADGNYKGKRVRVSGPFSKAEMEQGRMVLWFWHTGYTPHLGCYLDNSQRGAVAQLKDRQTIVVEGTMRGLVSPGRLMMDNCVLR